MDISAKVVVVGAGIGGLTAAGLLQRQGFQVDVYEQAENFRRIGAGIILGASTMKVMRHLGIEAEMVDVAIEPDAFVSRDMSNGKVLNEETFDKEAERRYGGPFLNIHRADLHKILVSTLQPGTLHFDHKLETLSQTDDAVELTFEGGKTVEADIAIGADGLRSKVREAILGYEPPRYTGKLAIRSVYPTAKLGSLDIRECVKWWGDDCHVLTYFMNDEKDEIYIMAAVPSDDWNEDSEPKDGTAADFKQHLPNVHPELGLLLEAAENVTLLPICDRKRNDDAWTKGRVALLGDASHAVRPFMAAGGSMAIEDAGILARAFEAADSVKDAFNAFRNIRIPRVGDVQRISEENSWLKEPNDPSWFFGYDPYAENIHSYV